MPLFSVVIPTHERVGLLCDAIGSVVAQTVGDWECIIAVDGGAAPSIPPDPRMQVVVRERNGGPGAARNTGVEHASGRYLAFLDDDDTWLPDRLELALEGLARAPVAVCHGLQDGKLVWRGSWNGDVADTILDAKAPSVNCVALRREAWLPFDETLRGFEDLDWLLRLAQVVPFATVARPGFVRGNAGTERPDVGPRLDSAERLLDLHSEYFATHRTAAARLWRNYGRASLAAGRRADGRRALFRAAALRPEPHGGAPVRVFVARPVT